MEKIIKDLGKPTKETELLRMWKVDETTEKEFDKEEGFEIDLGNKIKMKAMGSTTARSKETNEIIFAYKFKHEKRFILYYIPKETEETKKFLGILNLLADAHGYDLQNLKENMKSMKEEVKLMDKEDDILPQPKN